MPNIKRQKWPGMKKAVPLASTKERKLLARVVTYYQHTLGQNSRGINYLKTDLGIENNQTIKDFGAGFSDGTANSLWMASSRAGVRI